MTLPMDPLGKREQRALQGTLTEGEKVLAVAEGLSNQALVVTDRRAIIVKGGWLADMMFGGQATTFDFRSISTVSVRTSAIAAVFEITAPGVESRRANVRPSTREHRATAYNLPNCVPVGKTQLRKFEAAAALLRAQISGPGTPTPSPASSSDAGQHDVAEQIRKLASLRDDGIITADDFEAKKQELLARL